MLLATTHASPGRNAQLGTASYPKRLYISEEFWFRPAGGREIYVAGGITSTDLIRCPSISSTFRPAFSQFR